MSGHAPWSYQAGVSGSDSSDKVPEAFGNHINKETACARKQVCRRFGGIVGMPGETSRAMSRNVNYNQIYYVQVTSFLHL